MIVDGGGGKDEWVLGKVLKTSIGWLLERSSGFFSTYDEID